MNDIELLKRYEEAARLKKDLAMADLRRRIAPDAMIRRRPKTALTLGFAGGAAAGATLRRLPRQRVGHAAGRALGALARRLAAMLAVQWIGGARSVAEQEPPALAAGEA